MFQRDFKAAKFSQCAVFYSKRCLKHFTVTKRISAEIRFFISGSLKTAVWVRFKPFFPLERQRTRAAFRRLRNIFYTNIKSAHAAGRWTHIQENAEALPYLKYIASTAEEKRQSHMPYYGRIYRVDDPIWHKIYPPNGYGCRCSVRQLTAEQAKRERGEDIKAHPEYFTEQQIANHKNGILDDNTAAPPLQETLFENPRTGEKTLVPQNITPTFAMNPGDRLGTLMMVYRQKLDEYYPAALADRLIDDFTDNLAMYALDKIHSISEGKTASEQIQFQMTRLITLPPEVSSRIYTKMLTDKDVLETLNQEVGKLVARRKQKWYSNNQVLHLGTIPTDILARMRREKLTMPKTAVISLLDKSYGHAVRDNKISPLPEDFWQRLPEHLLSPDEVYYDAGKEHNAPSLLFVYLLPENNKRIVLTINYEIKKYANPIKGKKETLITNAVTTGNVMSSRQIKSLKGYKKL